jgi:hypothetical protein
VGAAIWTVIGMLGATLAALVALLLFQLGSNIDQFGVRLARIDSLTSRIDAFAVRADLHIERYAG